MADQDQYPPGSGPPARPLAAELLLQILREHQQGVLATNKRDGHPHLTNVVYVWDAERRTAQISTTAERANPRHLRRDPRCALQVSTEDFMSFAVAEGEAELSAVSTTPGTTPDRNCFASIRSSTPHGTGQPSSIRWWRTAAS